jgi:hypothetical protein
MSSRGREGYSAPSLKVTKAIESKKTNVTIARSFFMFFFLLE